MAERESGQPGSVGGSRTLERATAATSFMQRAVIRRRVRFLRRRRELALHDLGGFVFESHQQGQPRDDLLADKLAALTALDDELALLQQALELGEEVVVLREPGIVACAHCATIRDSAANFCPNCGRPARSRAAQEPDGRDAAFAPPAAARDERGAGGTRAEETSVLAPAAEADNTAIQPYAAPDTPAAVETVVAAPPPQPTGESSVAAADAPS